MRPYRYPAVSPSSSSSFYPAGEEWQQPGARLTEKFQRHEKLLNGSLMLLVAAVRTRPSSSFHRTFHHLSPLLVPHSSFSLFLFLPFLTFHLSLALTICSCVCAQWKFRGYGAFIPGLIRTGCVYSRIKLDNKLPESKRRKSRPVKEREDKYIREKERESKK